MQVLQISWEIPGIIAVQLRLGGNRAHLARERSGVHWKKFTLLSLRKNGRNNQWVDGWMDRRPMPIPHTRLIFIVCV